MLRAVVVRNVKQYETCFHGQGLVGTDRRVFTGDTGCRAINYPSALDRDKLSELYYVLHGVLVW